MERLRASVEFQRNLQESQGGFLNDLKAFRGVPNHFERFQGVYESAPEGLWKAI